MPDILVLAITITIAVITISNANTNISISISIALPSTIITDILNIPIPNSLPDLIPKTLHGQNLSNEFDTTPALDCGDAIREVELE